MHTKVRVSCLSVPVLTLVFVQCLENPILRRLILFHPFFTGKAVTPRKVPQLDLSGWFCQSRGPADMASTLTSQVYNAVPTRVLSVFGQFQNFQATGCFHPGSRSRRPGDHWMMAQRKHPYFLVGDSFGCQKEPISCNISHAGPG